jgi:predicted acylesterase/phospholipase RssA
MSLPFRALGLGGGGMKGILHIGALLELEKHQALKFPDGVYGCSVGSIIAAFVAFELPIANTIPFIQKHMSLKSIVPKFSMEHMSSMFSAKGMYSMDLFEERIAELFQDNGIDIRSKKIEDAHMPLRIVASNITKGVPTVFSGDVRVMDALKASCCIPGIFHPQIIDGCLYVDGGLVTPCVASIMSSDSMIVFTLSKQRHHRLTPSLIGCMSPIEYMLELCTIGGDACHRAQLTDDTVCLSYPNLRSDSDLSKFSVEEVLSHSGLQLHRFLFPKVLGQEPSESVGTGVP